MSDAQEIDRLCNTQPTGGNNNNNNRRRAREDGADPDRDQDPDPGHGSGAGPRSLPPSSRSLVVVSSQG